MSTEETENRAEIREVGRQEHGALSTLFDIILPRVCSVCDGALDSREQIICQSCRTAFQTVPEPVCPICGSWREESRTNREGKCPKCPKMQLYFTESHVPFYYRGALGDALKNFKYRRRLEMAESIAQAAFMALIRRERRRGMSEAEEADDPTGLRERVDVVAPVPLHYTRFLTRGYNQSEILARQFARLAGLQVDAKILKRIRRTPRQALLPAEKRYDNVRGAFQVTNPHLVRDKAVAVFDDVFTSGHTVNQCARVLVEAGAKKVFVLAVARA
ncbi:MAG: ComF family protein [Candidatus Sumerlaeota bacterium]